MIRISILFFLFSGNCALSQQNQCVMPQGWFGITPFGWKPNSLPDSLMPQISVIKLTLIVSHSWGHGQAQYDLEYRMRDSFFESQVVHNKYSGITHPSSRKGEGAFDRDSLFDRIFEPERLYRVLQSIQQPSPYWNEKDFNYTASKFQTDLTQLIRTPMSGYKNCSDCSSYSLVIRFFTDKEEVASIVLRFDDGFRLPRTDDTAIKKFKVRSMLEWMYLYQLCHLFFPENVALNKSHFPEKKIGILADWSKHKFPDIQVQKD